MTKFHKKHYREYIDKLDNLRSLEDTAKLESNTKSEKKKARKYMDQIKESINKFLEHE